jgi:hypothetical protein
MRTGLLLLASISLIGCTGEEVDVDPDEDITLRIDVIQDCKGETCDLVAGEVCCMDGMDRDGCAMSSSGCAVVLDCDGPEDCAEGERCCGGRDGNHCGSTCSDLVVCHDHRDCEGVDGAPVCRESLFVEMNYCKD